MLASAKGKRRAEAMGGDSPVRELGTMSAATDADSDSGVGVRNPDDNDGEDCGLFSELQKKEGNHENNKES